VNGEIVYLKVAQEKPAPNVRGQLREIRALLGAIAAGELLSALPDCPIALRDYQLAQTLLAMAESKLFALCQELDRIALF
jgi:hypothetical protein